FRAGWIPPNLHLRTLNPYIDFADTSFYLPDEPRPWTANQPRAGGVSSFGFGGVNAHVVLEEAPQREPPAGSNGGDVHVFPFSAKTEAALRDQVKGFLDWAEAHNGLSVAGVARTLQVGRDAFPHRIAVAGSTLSTV